MPRNLLIKTNLYPYHVTSRSRNQDWYQLPISKVWRICLVSLEIAKEKHPVILHSFVLMNNHYHLLLTTPDSNIDCFMYELNKNISRKIKNSSSRINQIFGGRYKWTIVDKQAYLYNVVRYIYQNPIRANICKCPEDYIFSSYHYHFNQEENFFYPLFSESNNSHFNEWLKILPTDKEVKFLTKALKRHNYFSLSKDDNNKKTIVEAVSMERGIQT